MTCLVPPLKRRSLVSLPGMLLLLTSGLSTAQQTADPEFDAVVENPPYLPITIRAGMNVPGYDNRQLALNVMHWLSGALGSEASEAAGRNNSEKHELREALSVFSDAYVAADVVTLEGLLSNDYIHVNGESGSILDRNQWLDWISQRREDLDAGRLVIEAYEVGEIEIRIHGRTAVIVGSVTSRERRSGELLENRLRFTNVWIRGKAGWHRAAFHDSSLRSGGAL